MSVQVSSMVKPKHTYTNFQPLLLDRVVKLQSESKRHNQAHGLAQYLLAQDYCHSVNKEKLLTWLDSLITEFGDLSKSIFDYPKAIRKKKESSSDDIKVAELVKFILSKNPFSDSATAEKIKDATTAKPYLRNSFRYGYLTEARAQLASLTLLPGSWEVTNSASNSINDRLGIDILIKINSGYLPIQIKSARSSTKTNSTEITSQKERVGYKRNIVLYPDEKKALEPGLAQHLSFRKLNDKKYNQWISEILCFIPKLHSGDSTIKELADRIEALVDEQLRSKQVKFLSSNFEELTPSKKIEELTSKGFYTPQKKV